MPRPKGSRNRNKPDAEILPEGQKEPVIYINHDNKVLYVPDNPHRFKAKKLYDLLLAMQKLPAKDIEPKKYAELIDAYLEACEKKKLNEGTGKNERVKKEIPGNLPKKGRQGGVSATALLGLDSRISA